MWVMTDQSELSHFDGIHWETVETFDFVGDLAAVWGPEWAPAPALVAAAR